jgi:hypothetical protein
MNQRGLEVVLEKEHLQHLFVLRCDPCTSVTLLANQQCYNGPADFLMPGK